MRDDQVHRGPDAAGLHTGPHVGLAFNRLAIIDLSPAANQPMEVDAGAAHIVFNGEIYNYRELRRELEDKGLRFRTQSDTEVILQRYVQWGIDVVRRLNGMFAFALWDPRRETLYLVRDRERSRWSWGIQDSPIVGSSTQAKRSTFSIDTWGGGSFVEAVGAAVARALVQDVRGR
jgi:asparagine synthetase B (glutamine-hydrolysing)